MVVKLVINQVQMVKIQVFIKFKDKVAVEVVKVLKLVFLVDQAVVAEETQVI